jgi:hypothetical protein
MGTDVLRLRLRALGVEQGGATSFGALRTADAAPEQSEAVLAIDFAHGESALARETKPLACRMDTRESIEVGSLHEVLL